MNINLLAEILSQCALSFGKEEKALSSVTTVDNSLLFLVKNLREDMVKFTKLTRSNNAQFKIRTITLKENLKFVRCVFHVEKVRSLFLLQAGFSIFTFSLVTALPIAVIN